MNIDEVKKLLSYTDAKEVVLYVDCAEIKVKNASNLNLDGETLVLLDGNGHYTIPIDDISYAHIKY